MRSGPVVSFEEVSKVYGKVRAVDRLSLGLRPWETVAPLGLGGAGKSTSLDMLLAPRRPSSGRILMFGSDPDPYHAIKSGRVGAMLQSGGRMPEVTVREDRADEGILRGLPSLARLEIRHDLMRIQSADADRTLPAGVAAGGRPAPAAGGRRRRRAAGARSVSADQPADRADLGQDQRRTRVGSLA